MEASPPPPPLADAGDAAGGPCDVAKPWAEPQELVVDDVAQLQLRSLAVPSPDGLMLLINARLDTTTGVYFSLRTLPGAPYGPPSVVDGDFQPAVSASAVHPSITADGLKLYYARTSVQGSVIHVSERPDRRARFGVGRAVSGLGGTAAAADPFVIPDGSRIYMADDVGNENGVDLFVAERGAGASSFGVPRRIDGASTLADEGFPVPSRDELTLYFARKVSGVRRVFVSTRSSSNATFGTALVVPMFLAGDVVPTGLSEDGCELYLTAGAPGAARFLVSRRPP